MLSSRIGHPLFKFNAFSQGSSDKDLINSLDVIFTASIKMPYVEISPTYTSWIFLDRMAFEEYGLAEEVLDTVSESVGGTRQEIQDRYKSLKEKNMGRQDQQSEGSGDYESLGLALVWRKA